MRTLSARWLDGAIVRMVNYNERDRVVGIFTETEGKISAFAPSARTSQKRFGGGLDVFSVVSAEVAPPRSRSSDLWRLVQIRLIDPNLGLRGRLTSIAYVSYLAECLWAMLGEGDPHPEIYRWWVSMLHRLSSDEALVPDVRLDLELLQMCGFAPSFKECLDCRSQLANDRVFFSFERGGVICERCRKSGAGTYLQSTSVFALGNSRSIPSDANDELRTAFNEFVRHTLGREPKSQRIREEILRARI